MSSPLLTSYVAGGPRSSSAPTEDRLHTKSYPASNVSLNALSTASELSSSAEQVTALPEASADMSSSQDFSRALGDGGHVSVRGESATSTEPPSVKRSMLRRASRSAARRHREHAVHEPANAVATGATFSVPRFDSMHDGLCRVWSNAACISISLEFGGLTPGRVVMGDLEALHNWPRVRVWA